jgi:predicted RNA-binding Zn-ribbon protein involved in translation (DUF1610 family)
MPKLPQKCLFLVQPLYSLFLRNVDTFGLQNYRTVSGVLEGHEARRAIAFAARKRGTKIARMPSSRKINLDEVQASLDKVCPKCGRVIPPAEVRRIDFEHIECPVCGERFVPGR